MTGPHAVKNIAAAGTVLTGAGVLYRLRVRALTGPLRVTAYDNTAASGTIIEKASAVLADDVIDLDYGPDGIAFSKGLHVALVAGTLDSITAIYGGSKAG